MVGLYRILVDLVLSQQDLAATLLQLPLSMYQEMYHCTFLSLLFFLPLFFVLSFTKKVKIPTQHFGKTLC